VSQRLARMVVRVPLDLNEALTTIAARLFNETRIEHSHSAIVRGLIAIGLAAVAGNDVLAPLFVNARVARGRRRGARRPPVAPLDLEFEDQHQHALERRQVVARPPGPRRP
jgi:hypothetical protein